MHVRSHLDYCDFIYHIPELKKEDEGDEDVFDGFEENDSDHEDENADVENSGLECRRKINLNFRIRALESIQYQAALAITARGREQIPSRSTGSLDGSPFMTIDASEESPNFIRL